MGRHAGHLAQIAGRSDRNLRVDAWREDTDSNLAVSMRPLPDSAWRFGATEQRPDFAATFHASVVFFARLQIKNPTHMKISSTLATFAAIGLVTTATGLVTGFAALPLFAATVSTLLLMIVVADYSAQPRYARQSATAPVATACVECMPLAA